MKAVFADHWLSVAALGWLAIVATPMAGLLESSMAGHVLLQIPLLVTVGYVVATRIENRLQSLQRRWNACGIPGVLLASFVIAFWMIPRWLDASLTGEAVAWAKYLSLTLLAGIPLGLGWNAMRGIARGVVKIEFLAMLYRLGWLYLISPDRLCNNYLLTDQIWLGRGMLVVGLALSLTWLIPVFVGSGREDPAVDSLMKLSCHAASRHGDIAVREH